MKKLTIMVEARDKNDLKYALQEALKQMETGYSSGDLRCEEVETGYWEITDDGK